LKAGELLEIDLGFRSLCLKELDLSDYLNLLQYVRDNTIQKGARKRINLRKRKTTKYRFVLYYAMIIRNAIYFYYDY